MFVRRIALLAVLATCVAGLAVPATAVQVRTARALRIMPLGDSITLGATGLSRQYKQENRTPGGYREPLSELLGASGIRHRFVGTSNQNGTPDMYATGDQWHEGHGGYRIDQVMADLAGVAGGNSDNGGHWLTGTSQHAPIYPDIVIVHLGTNDIFRRYDPAYSYPTSDHLVDWHSASQRARFVADMTERLRQLVETIYHLRPATRIVLSDVIPMGKSFCDPITGEYARSVAALVTREQARYRAMVFADVWSAFTIHTGPDTFVNASYYGGDRIHPNATGYNRMAAIYQNAVDRVLRHRY